MLTCCFRMCGCGTKCVLFAVMALWEVLVMSCFSVTSKGAGDGFEMWNCREWFCRCDMGVSNELKPFMMKGDHSCRSFCCGKDAKLHFVILCGSLWMNHCHFLSWHTLRDLVLYVVQPDPSTPETACVTRALWNYQFLHMIVFLFRWILVEKTSLQIVL